MNGENRKIAVQEEMQRADKAFRAAELLYENGLITDAVSKLYYYLLYHIRALMLSKGLEPRSHEGLLRLFGLYFVKTELFSPNDSHTFSKMMKYREEADYNPSYTFTSRDYDEFREEVLGVSNRIKQYLKDSGF